MHFSFSVTVFAVIVSLTECKIDRMHPRTYSCSGEVKKGISTTLNQMKCDLRPTLQDLPFDPDYEYKPPILQVNQCAGNCENNSCWPRTSKNVTRVVRRRKTRNGYNENWECVSVDIEEHESCGCMCRIKPEDCHMKQKYVNCKCVCRNQMQRKENCEKKMGMKWMENTCNCKCMIKNYECTSGHMWDRMICECVPNRPK